MIINHIIPPNYELHFLSYDFIATQTLNVISINGAGTPDSEGSTVDDVQLYEILAPSNE